MAADRRCRHACQPRSGSLWRQHLSSRSWLAWHALPLKTRCGGGQRAGARRLSRSQGRPPVHLCAQPGHERGGRCSADLACGDEQDEGALATGATTNAAGAGKGGFLSSCARSLGVSEVGTTYRADFPHPPCRMGRRWQPPRTTTLAARVASWRPSCAAQCRADLECVNTHRMSSRWQPLTPPPKPKAASCRPLCAAWAGTSWERRH